MNSANRVFVLLVFMLMVLASFPSSAQQDTVSEKQEGYIFTEAIRLDATPVKNQFRSGTCWSFATISLIESELLKEGKGEFDLSEMYIVRHTYQDKALRYVRMHGHLNLSPGGALPDAFYVLDNYGIVPEQAYDGLAIGEDNHVHGEMDKVIKAVSDVIIKNPNRKITPVWMSALNGILDAYLGEFPESFTYEGVEYTPKSFADMLGIKAEDYVQLTSFTHHPFYSSFIIEVPDNWNNEYAYNLPIEELIEATDHALENGHTVVWATDVSEKGFSHRNGLAIVPETDPEEIAGMERARWEQLSRKERDDMLYGFEEPIQEKIVTQEDRQKSFDNYTTTDDHAMHITGIAYDQNGTKYYIVKNSWGSVNNPYGGYLYASEAFFRYKTISVMLNKDSLTRKIKRAIR